MNKNLLCKRLWERPVNGSTDFDRIADVDDSLYLRNHPPPYLRQLTYPAALIVSSLTTASKFAFALTVVARVGGRTSSTLTPQLIQPLAYFFPL
jgi:hypothetical protein